MPTVLSLSALLGAIASPAPAVFTPQAAEPPPEAVCRDRIETARAERGLPKLDRETEADDKPLLIFAIDRRIGGCSVMVMKNDANDIRPLPVPKDGPLLRPAQ